MVGLISGPLPDDVSLADTGPETTPGEVLGATAASTFQALPTFEASRSARRQAAAGMAPTTPYDFGTGIESMPYDPEAESQPHTPQDQIPEADSNAQIKAAGAEGMAPFVGPQSASTVQSLIDDHLDQRRRADVIARNGNSILSGSVARFGVGALVSLADPLNDAAMMLPVAPEAFAAEKIAAASGLLTRTAMRTAEGGIQGAAGMAMLEPLNAYNQIQDHEGWNAGEALRNIAFGAVLGAGGHAIMGGLFGHVQPETAIAAQRASLAQVMHDAPVDVGAILAKGEADARTPGPSVFDPAAHEFLPQPEAEADAQDMARRTMNPLPDPEAARAERVNAATIDSAPKLEGVADKDLAEVNEMLASHKAAYDAQMKLDEAPPPKTVASLKAPDGRKPDWFGGEADVYRDGDTVIRVPRKASDPRAVSSGVLQPTEVNPANGAERLPFLSNVGLLSDFSAADIRDLIHRLHDDGLVIGDSLGRNFGMHEGRLVAIDPGAAREKMPWNMQHGRAYDQAAHYGIDLSAPSKKAADEASIANAGAGLDEDAKAHTDYAVCLAARGIT